MSRVSPFYTPGPITGETPLEGVTLDFNFGARLQVPEGDYHVRFTDMDTFNVLLDTDLSDAVATSYGKYYIRFRVELWKDGEKCFTHDLDLSGRNVRLSFPIGPLGDILAWFPYAEAFRVRHSCRLYCSMQRELAELLRPAYPEINFILPEDKVPDCYASYVMGLFSPTEESIISPVDHRMVGLWKCIPVMLGLEEKELRPKLCCSTRRTISEPYVCIAAKSTGCAKFWNNPRGWNEVTAYLKEKGYRVLCIDKEKSMTVGDQTFQIPDGAEDFTGDFPLQERADLLSHADFFIGLSSGLSWLAWAVGIPVVMISGFTLPYNEFYTPYRVINYHVCNGCWNDSRINYDLTDFYTCPRHKGTDRAYECTRLLTSKQVCRVIDRLMADKGLSVTGGAKPI